MEARLLGGNLVNRQEWTDLISRSKQGGCFVDPGFMDIVAPGWQALEIREEGELVALMPLNIKQKWGVRYSFQPPFAQYWGIIFKELPHTNPYRAFSWKRKVCLAVLDAIPKNIRVFAHTFSPEFDYATPFSWKGYQLTARYTYRLKMETDADSQWKALDKSKRSEITQAQKSGDEIAETSDLDALMPLVALNEEDGKSVLGHAQASTFRNLANYLMNGNGGKVIVAKRDGKIVAGGLFVFEAIRCVYLAGVQDPSAKKSGAMNAVLWEAIRLNAGDGRYFDFEGSMIEPIEAFFRGFGAEPVPYLFIQKNRLPLLVRWIRK